MGLAATAGCSGILGGGGGGCSVPDEDVEELLPESGNGFEQGQTLPFSNSGSLEGLDEGVLGFYTKDGTQYVAGVAKFEDQSAAQQSTSEVGQGESTGTAETLVYVQTGKFLFYAAGGSDAEESDVRRLLGQSAIGQGCVDANAQTAGG